MDERRARYRSSLNLPRTSFPMRADLAASEKLSLRRWEDEDLFARLMDKRKDAPNFVLQEAPLPTYGPSGIDDMADQVLKDLVVRSRNLNGERCHFVPCWDGYGPAIESQVIAGLHDSGRFAELDRLGPEVCRREIRQLCRERSAALVARQADQRRRLLTLADHGNPHLTTSASYEASALEAFASLVEQGLIGRGLSPAPWSIAHQAPQLAWSTTSNRRTTAVYARFEASDPATLAAVFGKEAAGSVFFLIWTANPWTLAANQLLAVGAEHDYSLVRLGGELHVVASDRVACVAALGGDAPAEELGRVRGAALAGLGYRHPFLERQGPVLAGDEHWRMPEDGTGIFPLAPGHGYADFRIGRRGGLEVQVPVGGDGRFDATGPSWLSGESIWEAEPKIVQRLRDSGHLYHRHVHWDPTPRDASSKTWDIVRGVESWSIEVDRPTARGGKSLRRLALDMLENELAGSPSWTWSCLLEVLGSRRHWLVSLPLYWSLPFPAFRRENGETLLTAASVRAVARVFGENGSEAWFRLTPEELLTGYDPSLDPDLEQGAGLDLGRLEKTADTFGGFCAGESLLAGTWWSAAKDHGLGFPAHLLHQGTVPYSDSLPLAVLTSLAATGQAPFAALSTQGSWLDATPPKAIPSRPPYRFDAEALLEQYGADVLRWCFSSLASSKRSVFDPAVVFDLSAESYRKVRNTLCFLLGNLYDFDESAAVRHFPPTSLDAWALGRAAKLSEKVLEAYFSYQFRIANRLLFDFCNDDLSAIYLDAVKDRLYCDRPDSPRRRATQSALRQIAELLIHLLAPILPHTADEAHRALRGEHAESVHLGRYPEIVPPQLDRHWDAVLALRAAARKALEEAKSAGIENPLDAGLVLPDPEGVVAAYRAELPEIFGVSRVHLISEGEIQVRDLRAEPRCERSWKRDENVRLRSDGGYLTDRDADAVGMT